MPAKTPKRSVLYQIKISLRESPLPIWRRLLIDPEMPLSMVHEVFQIAMGWWNYHLFEFKKGDVRYGVQSELDEDDTLNSDNYLLRDLLQDNGDKCVYTYDFGDDWHHEVVLEKRVPHSSTQQFFAECIHGKRACPPEDCGGISGFANCISAVEDPLHDEHEDMLQWTGVSYDPNALDVRIINLRLILLEADMREKAEFMAFLKAEENSKTQAAAKKPRTLKDIKR